MWIRAADKLPDPYHPVLVLPRVRCRLDRSGDVLVADICAGRDRWYVYDGSTLAMGDVEWWAPIPEVPDPANPILV